MAKIRLRSAIGPGRTDDLDMTPGRVLVLNAGSATLKATVLGADSIEPRSTQTIEWSEGASEDEIGRAVEDVVTAPDEGLDEPGSMIAVGHRVVHGGARFTGPTLIDDEVLSGLDSVSDLAPLHDPRAIATIRAARKLFQGIPHVAVFDTAFHTTLPEVARRYPVPDEWLEHGVRRFGFHGLSVEWSTRRAASLLGRSIGELQIVVAHLGGGCSVTAVDRGRSVRTSMGMTPLEGLMMGTRAGSIDPGIVFRLIRYGVSPDEIERALDHQSGLRGVGGTEDMRSLLASEADGDRRAMLAIEMFVDRAAAGIAAAATALDGLDGVVFTGGIGEAAVSVRSRICSRLTLLRIPEPSADATNDGVLVQSDGGPAVISVHAREDVVIAEAARSFV